MCAAICVLTCSGPPNAAMKAMTLGVDRTEMTAVILRRLG